MNHTITFLGVNDMFSNGIDEFHTNVWLEDENEKAMLIDCGTDAKVSIKKAGKKVDNLDAVYISHLHGDHCGSLEWLGYYTFFKLGRKLKLFIEMDLVDLLWKHLYPSMGKLAGRPMILHDYFDVIPIRGIDNPYFSWNNIHFAVIPVPHIKMDYGMVCSYGLSFGDENNSSRFWLTTDTNIANYAKPKHWCEYGGGSMEGLFGDYAFYYYDHDMIFHDCCFNSTAVPTDRLVHSTYNNLANFPDEIKKKMWLVHHPRFTVNVLDMVDEDGFAGYMKMNKTFKF